MNSLLSHFQTSVPSSSSTHTTERPSIIIPEHALHLPLRLTKSKEIPPYLQKACTKAFLQHILYSRHVIPCPTDELLRDFRKMIDTANTNATDIQGNIHDANGHQNNNNNNNNNREENHPNKKRRTRMNISDQKIVKHGQQLQYILDDLDYLFDVSASLSSPSSMTSRSTSSTNSNKLGVKAVLVSIGPSFMSPKEQYILRFHSWSTITTDTTSATATTAIETTTTTKSSSSSSSSSVQSSQEQTRTRQSTIPTNQKQRLEHEISRRIIRTIIDGYLQDEYTNMFQLRTRGSNVSNSNTKVNIAILVSSNMCQLLFDGFHGFNDDDDDDNTTPKKKTSISSTRSVANGQSDHLTTTCKLPLTASSTTSSIHNPDVNEGTKIRLTVRHSFQVKTPKMISKHKNIHGPYLVLDIIPMKSPYDDGDDSTIKISHCQDGEESSKVSVPRPEVATFDECEGDIWMTLQSFIKGFRL